MFCLFKSHCSVNAFLRHFATHSKHIGHNLRGKLSCSFRLIPLSTRGFMHVSSLVFFQAFHWLLIFSFLTKLYNAENGELPDERGMLLTEVDLLRRMVLEQAQLSTPTLRQEIADGKTWAAVQQLGSKVDPNLKQFPEPVEVRDLGVLRVLADIGIFEIVAGLQATQIQTFNGVNLTSRQALSPQIDRGRWLSSLAQDLRFLMKIFPRRDRALVAITHAVASHVMFRSFRADSDGYVRVESMSSITQTWWLAEQAASVQVRRICEVGFNAGHSALAMLSASADASMVSFDLMSKSYTPAGHRLVRLAFPQRHILIEGPSNVSIPQFILGNLRRGRAAISSCDLIFIDGGHAEEEALSDLLHMSMLATDKALLVMDDVGCESNFCQGPTKAWKSFAQAGRIEELGCQEESERRWCWGTYRYR